MHTNQIDYGSGLKLDLGNEAPIILHNEKKLPIDRKSLSFRWLIGIILTGMTSTLLVGGALFTTLSGQFSLTSVSDSSIMRYDSVTQTRVVSNKGDRQIKLITQVSDRQVLQINTMKRDGDRDHVTVRPFALVTSTLHTRKESEFADLIPPFDPVQLSQLPTSETVENEGSKSIYNAKIQGDVAISVLDFPLNHHISEDVLTMSQENIEASIRNDILLQFDESVQVASLPTFSGRLELENSRIPSNSSTKIRIKPENVTFLQKSPIITGLAGLEEVYFIYEDSVDLTDMLIDQGATQEEADSVIQAIRRNYKGDIPLPNQRIRFALAPDSNTGRIRPIRISIYTGNHHEFSAALTDKGKFDKAKTPTTIVPRGAFAAAERVTLSGPAPTIYESFYQTALQQKIPEEVINELVRLYLYDVDFNATIRPGDKFEVLYSLDQGSEETSPEILFTSLIAGGKDLSFYRFSAPESGLVDYYDPFGNSASKFLIRKPITGGVFRSGFGMRRHPILGYRKMHTGVDWAAPRRSKIVAAGDGIIERAAWSAGYGRRIEIRHSDGYLTTYSHLTQFEKNIKRGDTVTQGQLIGYVGSTGLSTGPHLHYEVKINNRFVDPMQIKLPRIQELRGDLLVKYRYEINQLQDIIASHSTDSKLASRENSTEEF